MYEKLYKMSFNTIYILYLNKIQRKLRNHHELNAIIYWLTGHDEESLNQMLESEATVKDFFTTFPSLNENAKKITGTICGVKIKSIEDPIYLNIRYLDKLVDELARGRPLEKIMRK